MTLFVLKLKVLFCKTPPHKVLHGGDPTSQINDVKNERVTVSGNSSYSANITTNNYYCKPFRTISCDFRPVKYMPLAAFADVFSKGLIQLGYKFKGDFRNHFLENVDNFLIHPDHLDDAYFILNQFLVDSSPKVKHVDRNFVRKLIEEVKKLD